MTEGVRSAFVKRTHTNRRYKNVGTIDAPSISLNINAKYPRAERVAQSRILIGFYPGVRSENDGGGGGDPVYRSKNGCDNGIREKG